MSIKVIQWVWDCSESKNAERLVLLAIADNAADDGTRAYPSVVEIARKANLSERGVQAAVARLVKSGELSVKIGGGRGRVNMYTVIMTPCSRRQTPQDLHPSPPADPGETPQNDAETPQNDAVNPADSAPGTVLEPSKEPSKEPSLSSFDAEASPNAGLIIKGFIDWLGSADEPVKLTPSVIARLGREIKSCLKSGIDEGTVKRALVEMARRGKAGWPSMLQSFVVEVQNRPVSGPPAAPRQPQFKSSAEQNIQRSRVERMRCQVADAIVEERGVTPLEALDLVEELTDEEIINLMTTSTVVGYSGTVLDAEAVEADTPKEVES